MVFSTEFQVSKTNGEMREGPARALIILLLVGFLLDAQNANPHYFHSAPDRDLSVSASAFCLFFFVLDPPGALGRAERCKSNKLNRASWARKAPTGRIREKIIHRQEFLMASIQLRHPVCRESIVPVELE